MELAFDDGLSEDWISQPRSSDPASDKNDSFLSDQTSATPASRIPRPKTTIDLSQSRPRQLLRRSLSKESNTPSRGTSRHVSAQSTSSVLQGTVYQKQSKEHSNKGASIPEWRKRLLQNGDGKGHQNDLFGPTGLEQAFLPPKAQQPSSKLCRTSGAKLPTNVYPSSPPFYPANILQVANEVKGRQNSVYGKDASLVTDESELREKSGTGYKWDADEVSEAELPPLEKTGSKGDNTLPRQKEKGLNHSIGDENSQTGLEAQLQNLDMKSEPPPEGIKHCAKENNDNQIQTRPLSTDDEPLPDSLQLFKDEFVTIERGGFAKDDSFLQKSLSDPSLSENSLPSAPEAPVLDLATNSSVVDDRPSTPTQPEILDQKQRASGSPLKLFDRYDTFTNACLNRRVSQFEQRSPGSSIAVYPDPRKLRSSPLPRVSQYTEQERGDHKIHPIGSFGAGELDSYGFDHRHPTTVDLAVSPVADRDQENQVLASQLRRSRHGRQLSQSKPILRDRPHLENLPIGVYSEKVDDSYVVSPDEQHSSSFKEGGKRIPNSPHKRRESKRRRTSEIIIEGNVNATFDEHRHKSSHSRSMAGQKRKDARYEKSSQTADPKIIASRPRLQPRASINSSRHLSYSRKTSADGVDQPTEILANELASFANGIAKSVVHGMRKQSVNTADYFREANMIMQNIRAKAQPSTLTEIIDDHAEDNEFNAEELQHDEFTLDTISRPASRDGGRVRNMRRPRQMSARVVSHLRKFGETDEEDNIDADILVKDEAFEAADKELASDHSEPPNIRIIERSTASLNTGDGDDLQINSNGPQDEVTGRSIPTASSGSTGRPQIIKPDTVSHLISENIGKMTFDNKLHRWTRRKSSKNLSKGPDVFDSELTEEDPFREIPDLAVDESQELKRIHSISNTAKISWAMVENSVPSRPNEGKEEEYLRPNSSGTVSYSETESSAITKISKFASSGPLIETRATSWGDQPPIDRKDNLTNSVVMPVDQTYDKNHIELAYKNEQISEGPAEPTSQTSNLRVRCGTVPVVSAPQQTSEENHEPDWEGPVLWEGESALDLSRSSDGDADRLLETSSESQSKHLRHVLGLKSRSFSIANKMFTPRPVSRIDECGELSLVKLDPDDGPKMQLALSTPQPLRDRDGTLTVPPTGGRNSSVGFHLSPLPDFTVNIDNSMSRDFNYVARRRGLLSLQDVEDKFSLAIRDLVQRITDVEPYEPYWEYIKKLELRDKKLLTLHMLDQFCQRVEELDVAENELGQINGAPASVRVMNISDNCLTGMTSWGHLHNLQYLNVSGNTIESLQGFSALVHLRELNAEDNRIRSLEGITNLDGLLRLNLGRNAITNVNFEGTDLQRLNELHIFGNSISSVRGLKCLRALEVLNLRGNKLTRFDTGSDRLPMSLKTLDLSENKLSEFDITKTPWLSRLMVDSNHLRKIQGLEYMQKLYFVSWRNQNFPGSNDTLVEYQNCNEAHSLTLSGNKLGSFVPGSLFLNMRRLELASCGLETLHESFGIQLPNLRFLNLNHNGIRDLAPLLGISGLEELHVVGNRINRLRRTSTILGKLSKALRIIDCRMNPLTIGFYAPKSQPKDQNIVPTQQKGKEWTSCEAPADASIIAELSYLVPAAKNNYDEEYEKRLDEETVFRRRVYELLIVERCERLEQLDGRLAGAIGLKDRKNTLKRLVELGVLRRKE